MTLSRSRRAAPFLSPWFRALFARTLALSGVLLAAAALVSFATDEAGNTPGMRLARVAALVPVAAAVAVMAIAARARSRGELRAIESLGASPWASQRGARDAALAFGLLTPVCLLLPATDPSSLFPVVRPAAVWSLSAAGAVSERNGVSVAADGTVSIRRGSAQGTEPVPSRGGALTVLVPLAIAVPFWAATPMSVVLGASSALASLAGSIVLLHAMAAGRAGSAAGFVATVPLLVAILRARRQPGHRERRSPAKPGQLT